MQRPRISVVGASGYTGIELVRLLLAHSQVELVAAGSDKWAGRRVEDSALSYVAHEVAASAEVDVVLLATPAEVSHALAPKLVARGARVVDLSGAFRLRDATAYRTHYNFEHEHPALLAEAVYSIPELSQRAATPRARTARLISNPGCYATAIQLALAPLVSPREMGSDPISARSVQMSDTRTGSSHAGSSHSASFARGLLESQRFVVDAMSGVTGAGRKATEDFSFAEIANDVRAYRVLRHQHTPEIEQGLRDGAGGDVRVTFVPHLLPIKRGILATCHAQLAGGIMAEQVGHAFAAAYEGERFIELAKSADDVAIKDVVGTNRCRIGWSVGAHGELVVVSAIDNLVKGAAGQAVQNLNLMLGLPEQAGLTGLRSFHP
jgi:N-acetyl-gamma-glutamyl-phosphate reductase